MNEPRTHISANGTDASTGELADTGPPTSRSRKVARTRVACSRCQRRKIRVRPQTPCARLWRLPGKTYQLPSGYECTESNLPVDNFKHSAMAWARNARRARKPKWTVTMDGYLIRTATYKERKISYTCCEILEWSLLIRVYISVMLQLSKIESNG
jgi:hypothetical protein